MIRKITLLVFFTFSLSIIFAVNKPCCDKKNKKNAVSCKYNKSNIDVNTYNNEKNFLSDRNASKCNTKEKIQCDKINKKPWWKFWAKKSINVCPCKKSMAAK